MSMVIMMTMMMMMVVTVVDALFEQCSPDRGGGICPKGNTCCRLPDGTSGCISSDMGNYYGTCCADDDDDNDSDGARQATGCPVGYTCRSETHDCQWTGPSNYGDDLVSILKRYYLCHADPIRHLYGYPIRKMKMIHGEHIDGKLAYYSSHGSIYDNTTNTSSTTTTTSSEPTVADSKMTTTTMMIQAIVVVVHGANRNADDYFCSMTKAVELQRRWPSEQVLVIAPKFIAETDDDRSLDSHFLYWETNTDGSWRYGANSKGPSTISSYTALDTLIEGLWNQFPHAEQLVVVGHSSGGQMVQRWTVVTSVWKDHHRMRAIVANPSSYVYLTPLRYSPSSDPSDHESNSHAHGGVISGGRWHVPNREYCPQYNQWQWGLDGGGPLENEYIQKALTNITLVKERYAQRHVIYMAGRLDRCNVSSSSASSSSSSTTTGRTSTSQTDNKPWCHSHGLETTCMDQWQGSNRFERQQRFMASLRLVNIWGENHIQRLVPGVGHDHSLMFQSEEGLESLFGTMTTTTMMKMTPPPP